MVLPFWAERYDVFVSFISTDATSLVSSLNHALRACGINTFNHVYGIPRGGNVDPFALKVIENSRSCIIIFSKNYAISMGCLEELVKSLDCMRTKGTLVFPVYYNVYPSDIQRQRRGHRKASRDIAKFYNVDMKMVRKWRLALCEAANMSGFWTNNRSDSEVIKSIVEEVSHALLNT